MIIEIDNLTPEQELAITDFFANWLKLGEKGVSKWTVAPTRENGLEENIWIYENEIYMIDPFDVQIDYTKLI